MVTPILYPNKININPFFTMDNWYDYYTGI